ALAKCQRRNQHELPKYLSGLQGRAKLVETNVLLRGGSEEGISQAVAMLEALVTNSPSYFANVTYAQVLMTMDSANARAGQLLEDVYTSIRNRDDLINVTEIRSKILLLIIA